MTRVKTQPYPSPSEHHDSAAGLQQGDHIFHSVDMFQFFPSRRLCHKVEDDPPQGHIVQVLRNDGLGWHHLL